MYTRAIVDTVTDITRIPMALISGLILNRIMLRRTSGSGATRLPARKYDVTTSSNENVKVRSNPAMIAGSKLGIVTRPNTPTALAPRSAAASSSGIERDDPRLHGGGNALRHRGGTLRARCRDHERELVPTTGECRSISAPTTHDPSSSQPSRSSYRWSRSSSTTYYLTARRSS